MKVTIEIPNEFKNDLINRFSEFFGRVSADIDYNIKEGNALLCGNYEKEIADMFLEAFKSASISSEVVIGQAELNAQICDRVRNKGE